MWQEDNKSSGDEGDKEQESHDDGGSEPLDGLGGARRQSSIDSEKLLGDTPHNQQHDDLEENKFDPSMRNVNTVSRQAEIVKKRPS